MEQVWLATLTFLTAVAVGWFTVLKLREANNVKALTERVAELEEERKEKEELIKALKLNLASTQRQNVLMKNERAELIRMLARYQKAGQESLIVVDEKGIVVDWDAAATLMFGYAADEAIGRDISGLIVPPEDRQHHRYVLTQTFINRRSPRTVPLKVKAICKDGEKMDVEVQLLPGWETGRGEESGWRYGARIRKLILPSPDALSDQGIGPMEIPQ